VTGGRGGGELTAAAVFPMAFLCVGIEKMTVLERIFVSLEP
jgi:hypothetical protein